LAFRNATIVVWQGVLFGLVLPGCGPPLGALWYHTFMPSQKVPAEFELPEGPLLILVDDDQDLIQPPLARHALVDALARQLKAHGVADRVTKNEELARLRQSDPEFESRGTREVGQLLGADTVLWLSTVQFVVEDDLEIASTPGKFAVTLKVVNALAEERRDVRLWPPERKGRLVVVTVSSHDIRACRNQAEVHQKMGGALATEIGQLFYEKTVEQ